MLSFLGYMLRKPSDSLAQAKDILQSVASGVINSGKAVRLEKMSQDRGMGDNFHFATGHQEENPREG